MSNLTLEESPQAPADAVAVIFKVPGSPAFELELELTTAVRDVKKFAKELCNVEPEHMKLIYDGRVLKESDTLECYKTDGASPVMVHFTAGHEGLVGGSVPQRQQRNPF